MSIAFHIVLKELNNSTFRTIMSTKTIMSANQLGHIMSGPLRPWAKYVQLIMSVGQICPAHYVRGSIMSAGPLCPAHFVRGPIMSGPLCPRAFCVRPIMSASPLRPDHWVRGPIMSACAFLA